MAADLGGDNVLYVATAQVGEDEDLARRVEAHRERRPAGWETVEICGGDLTRALEAAAGRDVALVDSLTLWVSARMLQADEAAVLEEVEDFVEGAGRADASFVVVSDEVGLGVVPESVAGRRFRDLLGEVNQKVGAAADEVFLCVAGAPLRIR